MDLANIISMAVSVLGTGSIGAWVYVKEKKKQEKEKSAQEHQHTEQEKIDTREKEFKYLIERIELCSKDNMEFQKAIVELNEKDRVKSRQISEMQERMLKLENRAIFAENNICLVNTCKKRVPKKGTYCPQIKETV